MTIKLFIPLGFDFTVPESVGISNEGTRQEVSIDMTIFDRSWLGLEMDQ